ncbi:hypothetical protein BaRGS_00003881 [Batillaria attramentaria]|uniref:Uncharacterized protein n=1 Tax=Batillaria attramentaria TaxID=370345 RepID=A0ABD0M0D2_9CAEN
MRRKRSVARSSEIGIRKRELRSPPPPKMLGALEDTTRQDNHLKTSNGPITPRLLAAYQDNDGQLVPLSPRLSSRVSRSIGVRARAFALAGRYGTAKAVNLSMITRPGLFVLASCVRLTKFRLIFPGKPRDEAEDSVPTVLVYC